MKMQHLNIIAQAEQQVQDSVLRSKVIAAALATAIARTMSLPSAEVEHAGTYFSEQVMPMAMRTISEFNESMVFDARLAFDYTRQLWKLRYASAYNVVPAPPAGNGDFINSFTGANVCIAPNFRCFLEENALTVASLSQFFASTLAVTGAV